MPEGATRDRFEWTGEDHRRCAHGDQGDGSTFVSWVAHPMGQSPSGPPVSPLLARKQALTADILRCAPAHERMGWRSPWTFQSRSGSWWSRARNSQGEVTRPASTGAMTVHPRNPRLCVYPKRLQLPWVVTPTKAALPPGTNASRPVRLAASQLPCAPIRQKLRQWRERHVPEPHRVDGGAQLQAGNIDGHGFE
jgi:hypothetical protein